MEYLNIIPASELLSLSGLLTTQLAIGAIIGFFMGFAIKKITKIAIFIIGIFFLLLLYLEYSGFITIDYSKITEIIRGIENNGNNLPDVMPFLKPFFLNIPSMVGFGAGFIIGLKKG